MKFKRANSTSFLFRQNALTEIGKELARNHAYFNADILKQIRELCLGGAFFNASGKDKMLMMTRLHMTACVKPDLANESYRLAFNIQLQEYPCEDIEDYEDDLLLQLHARLKDDRAFMNAYLNWGEISIKRRLDTAKIVAEAQADIFGFEAAHEIIPYKRAANDHADMRVIDAYILSRKNGRKPCLQDGMIMRGETAIALNLHDDALNNLDSRYRTLSILVHEQNHLHQNDMEDGVRKFPADHPYNRFAEVLPSRRYQPWRAHTTLGYSFYRTSIEERHSFALEEKFKAILQGRQILREKDILAMDLDIKNESLLPETGPD